MEKTYVMTIRDLTNEARELNTQKIEIKSFEEEVKKEIKIMAENHVSAIASYLNHQLGEVTKFTKNFCASYSSFGNDIFIRFKEDNYGLKIILSIRPSYYSEAKEFVIQEDNSIETRYSGPITQHEQYLEILLNYWKPFKNELQKAISAKLKSAQKVNEEKQKSLQEKLSLYENFEL